MSSKRVTNVAIITALQAVRILLFRVGVRVRVRVRVGVL